MQQVRKQGYELCEQGVIGRQYADKEAILRDIEYARQIAILSEMLAKEYLAQGEKEKALQNLQKSLEIKRIIYDHGDEEVMRIVKQMDRRPLRIETGM